MEKVRIGNDIQVKYTVLRDGLPETFVGATNIVVTVKNEAYGKIIPSTFSILNNIVTISLDAVDCVLCGKHRVILSYNRGNDITIDSLAFELVQFTGLTGGTEIVGVEIVTVNISGDIGIAIPDNNKIDLNGLNSNIDKLHFKQDTLIALADIGDVRYSPESRTLEVKVSDTVSIQLGQEMQTRVKNDAGVQINNGQLVYINSAAGENPLAKIASTTDADIAQRTFGMATENIASNGFGAITTEGLVRDVNTAAFSEGAMLWLGTNGSVTATEPVAPTSKISVGMVLRSNVANGVIYVKIRAIARNQKLSDVYAPTLTGGDVLRWNSTTLRFETFNVTTALSGKVSTIGNETIAGVKTFSSSPIIPTPTADLQASTKKYADDLNNTAVHKTGNETVAGVKTFSSSPIVPTPTTDTQATTKKYVDDADASLRADLNEIETDLNELYVEINGSSDITVNPMFQGPWTYHDLGFTIKSGTTIVNNGGLVYLYNGGSEIQNGTFDKGTRVLSENVTRLRCSASVSQFYEIVVKGEKSLLDNISEDIYEVKLKTETNTLEINEIKGAFSEILPNTISERKIQFQLQNDLDYFEGSYSQRNLAQYTKPATSDLVINAVRVNGVGALTSNSVYQYRIYIVRGANNSERRDAPSGLISESTHTLIKSGELNLNLTKTDYVLPLNSSVRLVPGDQVSIYISSTNGNYVSMRGGANVLGNSDGTSNSAMWNTTSDPWGTPWNADKPVNNLGYYSVSLTLILDPIFVTEKYVNDAIDDFSSNKLVDVISESINLYNKLNIQIPDIIYAVVGRELILYNDNISFSIDRGLSSPINYSVEWISDKGIRFDRGYRYLPTFNDVGIHTCKCTIYTSEKIVISEKTFNIETINLTSDKSNKNVLFVGDSLGESTVKRVYELFNLENYTSIKPNFVGTRGSTVKHESYGGWGWNSFITQGEIMYRVFISDIIVNPSVGSNYSDSYGNRYLVNEVNISDGAGNILLSRYSVALNMPSGTLYKYSGTGDNEINYTNGTEEPTNPFWDAYTNSINISKYRTDKLGIDASSKIDIVYVQLGINSHLSIRQDNVLRNQIITLYNAFIVDNPDCIFIIGVPPHSCNTSDGTGNANSGFANYEYAKDMYNMRNLYIDLSLDENYTIDISAANLSVDRYYGYRMKYNYAKAWIENESGILVENDIKYLQHINYVHPSKSGYDSLGSFVFCSIVGALVQL